MPPGALTTRIKKFIEGHYRCVYKDPIGIPKIGIRFNLEKANAKEEIESVGAYYNTVLNSQCLDDSQIERLFDMDTMTILAN